MINSGSISFILKVKIRINAFSQFKNILISNIRTEVQRPVCNTRVFHQMQENWGWLLHMTVCLYCSESRILNRRSRPDGRKTFRGKNEAAAVLHHFCIKQETAIVCKEKMMGSAGKDLGNSSAQGRNRVLVLQARKIFKKKTKELMSAA